jgi:hypothetical protein
MKQIYLIPSEPTLTIIIIELAGNIYDTSSAQNIIGGVYRKLLVQLLESAARGGPHDTGLVQYPWVVLFLLEYASTRQATQARDRSKQSVMRRMSYGTNDRHDGTSPHIAVTKIVISGR